MESKSYYEGLHSKPTLLYRTGKKWSPPRGPEVFRHLKELRPVYTHPIVKLWNNDLSGKVFEVLDAHMIRFTTIDVVRFKMFEVDDPPVDKEEIDEEGAEKEEDASEEAKKSRHDIGPVTIWIGVFPGYTSATVAHDAAQDILSLLRNYQITDVDVDFRESYHKLKAGPQLLAPVNGLNPLVDLVSPLSPTLGLHISTKARPDIEGTMALYLAQGGGSDNLLGFSCRHVLIGPDEANMNYVCHPRAPRDEVIVLGTDAFTCLIDSVKRKIEEEGYTAKYWAKQIEKFKEMEKSTNPTDIENAKAALYDAQCLLEKAEKALQALPAFLKQANNWKKPENRVLGRIIRSPPISLGVSEKRFTEDWGIFQVDRSKLGNGFQGNKIDLGTKMTPGQFKFKCFPRGNANWQFEYPDGGLLPLMGIITDDLMHTPDMWDSDGEPCLLVIKAGSATNTTIGRANGVFSIVRNHFRDMSIHQTSMEWAILNYDSHSEVFSKPGDSGAIIADIRGRIGGMLTGGSGMGESPDITYATPFWWLLERIKANGFPDVHLDVTV